jgi:uncharacterized protein (DUF302 family)
MTEFVRKFIGNVIARLLIVTLVLPACVSGEHAMSAGLVTLRSDFGPEETISRLDAEIRARGMTIFAQIDHASAAVAVGLPLRPTNLLIFGSAKAGTPLMQSIQTIGIDLPLKALVWQDEAGETFLSYNDIAYIARRHGVAGVDRAVVRTISQALKDLAEKTVKES